MCTNTVLFTAYDCDWVRFFLNLAQDEGDSLYSGRPPPGVLCSLRD